MGGPPLPKIGWFMKPTCAESPISGENSWFSFLSMLCDPGPRVGKSSYEVMIGLHSTYLWK